MRRLIVLIAAVLIILCVTACDASEKQEATEDGVMTEIKDDDGNLTGYERRYHNDKGDITRWDVYDENQTYQYYILYEYDDDGRLSSETRYSAEGFGEYRYVYTYDDDGNLSEKAYEDPHGEATVTCYDADGSEIEHKYFGTDDKLIKREVLEDGMWVAYDADGQKIE